MPAGLGTLFVGLLLIVLAFVEGDSVWKSAHQILFGLFGCGSFVLGAAVCYLAILYTRGQDLLMQVFKLLLGLIFASGTVIVFSDIPADLTAAQMIAACYQNGANAWLGGGVLGTLLVAASQNYNLLQSIGFGFGSGVGYLVAVLVVDEGRRRLRSKDIPHIFRGLPSVLIYIGILSLAIYGLVGTVD